MAGGRREQRHREYAVRVEVDFRGYNTLIKGVGILNSSRRRAGQEDIEEGIQESHPAPRWRVRYAVSSVVLGRVARVESSHGRWTWYGKANLVGRSLEGDDPLEGPDG